MKYVVIFVAVFWWLVDTSYGDYLPQAQCQNVPQNVTSLYFYKEPGTVAQGWAYVDCNGHCTSDCVASYPENVGQTLSGGDATINYDLAQRTAGGATATLTEGAQLSGEGVYCKVPAVLYDYSQAGDTKECDSGYSLNMSDCSCEPIVCPTGYHMYQDTCIQDDTCPDKQNAFVADCDNTYGASNWDGNYTCTYDNTTGFTTETGSCWMASSSSSAVSSTATSTASSTGTSTASSTASSSGFSSSAQSSYSSSASSVDGNSTAETMQELADFHNDTNRNLFDINTSINNQSGILRDINQTIKNLNNTSGVVDPCKKFDRNSKFVQSNLKRYTWMKDFSGNVIYGYCDCEDCFVIDTINYTERCLPDPFCASSSSSSSSSSDSDYLADINQTTSSILDQFDYVRSDLSDINDTVATKSDEINGSVKNSSKQNHSDLVDINGTLVKGFKDLNDTLSKLDMNLSDLLEYDANVSSEVEDAQSQIDMFIENVKNDIETLKNNFANTQNLFSQPMNYTINAGAEPKFIGSFHNRQIEIDLCSSFTNFAPIISLMVQIGMMILTVRLFWTAIKFSLLVPKQ